MRKSSLKRSGMARVNDGSHSFTCHPHVYPQVNIPYLPLLPNRRASPHIGWYSFSIPLRVESWVGLSGWLQMRWFTHPQMVTHPSANRARRRVTLLIETNALPLSKAKYRSGRLWQVTAAPWCGVVAVWCWRQLDTHGWQSCTQLSCYTTIHCCCWHEDTSISWILVSNMYEQMRHFFIFVVCFLDFWLVILHSLLHYITLHYIVINVSKRKLQSLFTVSSYKQYVWS